MDDYPSKFLALGAQPLAESAPSPPCVEPLREAEVEAVETAADGMVSEAVAASDVSDASHSSQPSTPVTLSIPRTWTASPDGRVLVFDTETASLRGEILQLAWNVYDGTGTVLLQSFDKLLQLPARPRVQISPKAMAIHKITPEKLRRNGLPPSCVLPTLRSFGELCKRILGEGGRVVAHNARFDCKALGVTWRLHGGDQATAEYVLPTVDEATCTMMCAFKKVPVYKKDGLSYKWPSNSECFEHFFHKKVTDDERLLGKGTGELHDAMFDISVTALNFFEMRRRQWCS